MKYHGFQPGARPPRVEERLVADDLPTHPPDALRVELRGELEEVERREHRVAVALEEDVPAPHRALQLALAERVGREAEARPEREQAGVRDRELLVRSGYQREPEVVRVDGPAGSQVDRDGAGARLRDVGDGECPRELFGKRDRACGGARRGGEENGRERDGHEPTGHVCILQSALRTPSSSRRTPTSER